MTSRPYFSLRAGRIAGNIKLTLEQVNKLYIALFGRFEQKGYFQETLGKQCPDGFTVGTLGEAIPEQLLLQFRREIAWPPHRSAGRYTRDDLFDVIEFCFDSVSKPISGTHHAWDNCGMHYDTFSKTEGQSEYRDGVNAFLLDFEEGWVLSTSGVLESKTPSEFEPLVQAEFPEDAANEDVEGRTRDAGKRFRQARTTDERRIAVQELAHVLEFIRRDVKEALLEKDEKELYNIANNFQIRHHRSEQRSQYDSRTWHTWMFYVYLATIHAVVRVKQQQQQGAA